MLLKNLLSNKILKSKPKSGNKKYFEYQGKYFLIPKNQEVSVELLAISLMKKHKKILDCEIVFIPYENGFWVVFTSFENDSFFIANEAFRTHSARFKKMYKSLIVNDEDDIDSNGIELLIIDDFKFDMVDNQNFLTKNIVFFLIATALGLSILYLHYENFIKVEEISSVKTEVLPKNREIILKDGVLKWKN